MAEVVRVLQETDERSMTASINKQTKSGPLLTRTKNRRFPFNVSSILLFMRV